MAKTLDKALRVDLNKLEKLTFEAIASLPNSESFTRFRRALRSTDCVYGSMRHPEVVEVLTKGWLKYLTQLSYHCDQSKTDRIYYMQQAMSYFVRKHQVKNIVTSEENRNLLAHAILVTVRDASIHTPLDTRRCLANVLSQWLDQKVSTKNLRSLEHAINMIYGPAVWSLYRSDVIEDSEMLDLLHREKIPTRAPKANNVSTPSLIDLPNLVME